MLTESDLRKTLMRINGRGYRAYRDIRGNYELGAFRLSVDHVQGDPFASPSRMSVYLESRKAGFPTSLARNKIRSIALADFLTRSSRSMKQHKGDGVPDIVDFSRLIAEDRRFSRPTA